MISTSPEPESDWSPASDPQFLPLRLDMRQHAVHGFDMVRLHVKLTAGYLHAVLSQQLDQVGCSGDSRNWIHVRVQAKGQGEDGVDSGLLLHVLGRCGHDRQV